VLPDIVARSAPAQAVAALTAADIHPLLARVYAARGIESPQQLATGLTALVPFTELHNAQRMAQILADAISAQERLLIVADYDADGATGCAVGVRALRALGANVDYLVPNRFEYGYGLTPEIVALAQRELRPDVLVTTDNGIASIEGVAAANRLGMRVLVTDHHLPGTALPDAQCIVNPNQAACAFPSKHLAGVGVIYYVMLALRAELRQRGAFTDANQPNFADLLDLVALGTVADVVRLDGNNRILVHQGLRRIRGGRMQAGIAALLQLAARDPERASAYDLGFVLGPRLNAAGRLRDMTLGIECLITDDAGAARRLAAELDALNRERRTIEAGMQDSALAGLDALDAPDTFTLCLFDPAWHQGVVGILASRLKERFHRPVFAFARGNEGEIKGSGRSISTLHLRDALDLVAKRAPGLVVKFGGHAAAAGVTLREADFNRFSAALEDVARELLTPADLRRVIETDGGLPPEHATLQTAALLEEQVWGHGFPLPCFDDTLEVIEQQTVAAKHLRLRVALGGLRLNAMRFFETAPLPRSVRAVYRLGVNEFNGYRTLRLTIEHWQPA
jgi:single-stranded-DNA-specific exonuclease